MDDAAGIIFFFFIVAVLGSCATGHKMANNEAIENCVTVLEDFSHKEIKAYCEKLILNKDPK